MAVKQFKFVFVLPKMIGLRQLRVVKIMSFKLPNMFFVITFSF